MASECTQEAILDFLKENGGKVKNTDLIEHFKVAFPEEPEKKAAVRQTFKSHVDHIAFVKTESDVKYVCLKKKFRGSLRGQPDDGTRADREPAESREGLRGLSVRARPAGSRSSDAAAELPAWQPPGSGYGNDSQVRVPHAFNTATIRAEQIDGEEEMGNRGSFKREKRESRKESKESRKEPDIPDISVSKASPLPAEGSMFILPGPVQTGPTGQVDAGGGALHPGPVESLSPEGPKKEVEGVNVAFRSAKGSQRGLGSDEEEEEEEDEGPGSPKGSRKHFLEAMMSSSPQLRRSVYLTSGTDGDSASLASSNPDDERASVALDPLEHEWMLCASDGEWARLLPLLAADPSLVLRRDFVTGFTCLHWAAKQGKPELMALLIDFAKRHDVPVGADVRSSAGYTPLHVAAMHDHMEVVKLLVGAYGADVEVRDHGGRKACQYLTDNASVDIRDIIGAYERCDSENDAAARGGGGRWRFSEVLRSDPKPLRLLDPNDGGDCADGEVRPRAKVLRSKSSLSRMRPKLHRLRVRTSQIIHSATFREAEEGSGSGKGSFRARPKTHFFG